MESIKKIKEYFLSIEMYEGRWVMSVKYKPKWRAYASADGKIKVSKDENEEDVWWYYASDDSIDIDDIINLVTETISTNIEAIKKVELFKTKAEELKKLFADESLSFDKLKSLKFIFDKPVTLIKDKVAKVISNNEEQVEIQGVKPEIKSKKKTKKKEIKEEINDNSSITPDEMTQDEIDNLRG